ncbi:hypothetical protein [Streptomyces sp. CB01881]|uniref:hypothetical protein n=1 Tax=Streptomyces sp. CB01881 TaxID=2078691 RepID=UPI000CDC2B82|nr:hypothetical protein [Streptomyces sp. CB01881]AUY52457.1 hypothetical protein C2142_30070 [Streptomyces sp. CB01881]TYC71883.1 hypothetical protein EH183_30050 [Streptomyces sp. CB01881]
MRPAQVAAALVALLACAVGVTAAGSADSVPPPAVLAEPLNLAADPAAQQKIHRMTDAVQDSGGDRVGGRCCTSR